MPSYRAYMDRSVQLSVSCEQQDGISLIHCNANKSATTIQDIEILGAIRIKEKKEWKGMKIKKRELKRNG